MAGGGSPDQRAHYRLRPCKRLTVTHAGDNIATRRGVPAAHTDPTGSLYTLSAMPGTCRVRASSSPYQPKQTALPTLHIVSHAWHM